MVMLLDGRLTWRQMAPFHIQLELAKPQDIEMVPGDIRVHGRVVRIFRTDGRVAIEDHLAFTLWLCREGDEPTGPAYIYYDTFKTARYMEVYLYGDPPECKLAGYEFDVIAAPTEEPTLTPRELETLLEQLGNRSADPSSVRQSRWWQFWRGSANPKGRIWWHVRPESLLAAPLSRPAKPRS